MRAQWKVSLIWLTLAAILSPRVEAACTSSISPANRPHGAGMATNTVAVTAGVGCTWTVENTNGWITILGGASGSGTGLVTYAVAANPNPLERTGVVVIATNVFTIRQAALVCAISLSPTTRTHGPGAVANFVTINANGAGCGWSVVNTNPWIAITSPTSGSGSATFDYEVTANPGMEWRTGVVEVAGQTFSVFQRGLTCTYDLTPSSRNHGHGSASNGFSVATTSGCSWSASTTAPWITIVPGSAATGNGVAGYTIASNPSGQARTGLVAVADTAFTLVQAGQPCSYSILALNTNHSAASETGLVTVTTITGCPWSVDNTNGWILVNSGATGLGSGTVGYTVTANPGPGPRAGSFSVGGQIVTLTQPAPECFYKVSPTNRTHGYTATSNQFTITVAAGCAWSVVNTSSWIQLRSPATGAGDATIAYGVEANPSPSSRTATLVVQGQALTLTQLGISCGIGVSPADRMHGHGAATNSITVSAAGGCDWAAVTTNSWITITSGTNGTGNGVVGYVVAPNPSGLARSGSILVADEVFAILQSGAPCVYDVSPGSRNHGFGAASNGVTVMATPGCAWSVQNTNPWITLVTGANGAGDGAVGYLVAANMSIQPRTGTLVIAGLPFVINQAGAPCSFSIEPTEGVHGFNLETGLVRVTAVSGCAWTVSNTNGWVAITSGGGGGTQSGTVGYVLATNPGQTPRIGYLTIAGQVFTVSQGATTCNYRLSPTNRNHGYAATSNYVALTVSNGCNWSVVNTNPWVSVVTPTTGSGSATIGYLVSANTLPAPRSAVILVGGQPYTINQNAVNCDFSLSPTSRSHGPAPTSNSVTVTDLLNCGWNVANTNGWISFLSESGTGNGSIGYLVAGNTTAVERVGIVLIGGESLTITQQAANCTIGLSPASRMHGPGAATNTITVTDAAGCGWAVINTNGWLSFPSLNGSGSAVLTYSVAANATPAERTAVVVIGGQSFMITQQPASCAISVSPSGRMHGSGATVNSLSVSDSAGCGWSVVNTSSWVTITSPLSGVGAGTVNYSVAANPGLDARSAVVLVADEPFTITQSGVVCTFRLSPTNRTHGFLATTNTFIVNTSTNCPWSVVNTNPWISILSAASGVGSNVVAYAITPNLTTNLRSGVIVVGDALLNIQQRGATNGFGFEVVAIQDGTQLRLRLVGAPTGVWELQGSADLRNWARITDVTNVAGVVEYVDPTPTTIPHRFFRAVQR